MYLLHWRDPNRAAFNSVVNFTVQMATKKFTQVVRAELLK